jgi:hypothetical protein
MISRKSASLLSVTTAGLLLGGVAVRAIQDRVLLASAGSDPLSAGLLAVEIVVLSIAAALGLAGINVGRMTWSGRMQPRLLVAIVFGIILLGGLGIALAGGAATILGWLIVLSSGATLVLQFGLPRTARV